jgi:hypothetical protein
VNLIGRPDRLGLADLFHFLPFCDVFEVNEIYE